MLERILSKQNVLLGLIILVAVILRFYKLDAIPAGINYDEASHGYNAYSLLLTGNDEYGMFLPIFLRSFGYYASTLYTYLTIIPIFFAGLTVFSVRFISAVSGVMLVLLTYLIVNKTSLKEKSKIALISSLIVTTSPWSILFSRGAFEANLALTILVAGVYFLILSLHRAWYLILAVICLAISTYAYQSERILALLLLVVTLIVFKEFYKSKGKFVWISLGAFFLIQLPQILLLQTEGARIRFSQLSYLSFFDQKKYSENYYLNQIMIKLEIIREFLSQYFAYLSPRNLFFDPDPQAIRSIPALSVFFEWFLVPFIASFKLIKANVNDPVIKMLLILALLSPIPAASVSDPFSSLRVLPLFWAISVFISIGIYQLFIKIPNKTFALTIFFILFLYSIWQIYINYFILLKYERSADWGYTYKILDDTLKKYPGREIVFEDHSGPAYIEFLFYEKYDPAKLQKQIDQKIKSNYYNNVKFNPNYQIENTKIGTINWENASNRNIIFVGDFVNISDLQVRAHSLRQIFEIKDLNGQIIYRGFEAQN